MYNLLFSSSQSGAPLLQVTINSFLKQFQNDVEIFILCSKWNEKFRFEFEKKISIRCRINYIEIDDCFFEGINNTVGLPLATLYRLCGIEMLPDYVHEILYTDIDVVCVSPSVKVLYKKLRESCRTIAAVADSGIPDKYAENLLGVHLMEYFNAGVLFINVDYCRSISLWDKSKDLLIENKFVAVDQDILNIIFKDNYYSLSHRYNYMSPQIFKDMLFYHTKNVVSSFSPVLVHYDGPQKPWFRLCANPFSYNFSDIAKEFGISVDLSLNRDLVYKLKLLYQFLKFKIVGKL